MPLTSQGYCAVGRGLSGLHWVRCNGRGPHLEWRQETHVSSPDFPWARSDSDRSFAAEFEQESQASSCVEEWNSTGLSSCSPDNRPLVELCVEPAVLSGRCMGVLYHLLGFKVGFWAYPYARLQVGKRKEIQYQKWKVSLQFCCNYHGGMI